jgi:hypothetical protein
VCRFGNTGEGYFCFCFGVSLVCWVSRGETQSNVRYHEGLCLSTDRQHTGGEFGAGAWAIQEGIQTVLYSRALSFLEETIIVSLGLGYFSVISFTRYGRILVWEYGVVKVNRLRGD